MEPESYSMRMFLSQNKAELQAAGMYNALSFYVAEDEDRERAASEDDADVKMSGSDLSDFIGVYDRD